jgi:hypothetical protein
MLEGKKRETERLASKPKDWTRGLNLANAGF